MRNPIGMKTVTAFVEDRFEDDLHTKRVESLTNATAGTIRVGALGIHAIGRGLALAKKLKTKHTVKQVDRLLSNEGIDVWALFGSWVPYLVAQRTEIIVALDWTEFDADKQMTLSASLISSHGRASPLMWLSCEKSSLEGMKDKVEEVLLHRLREVLPATVTRAIILADRGFGNPARWLDAQALGFEVIYRVNNDTRVTDAEGKEKAAQDWVGPGGRTVTLKGALVTGQKVQIAKFVATHAKKMKEPWCLISTLEDVSGAEIVKLYGRRFTIEESFRDIKDLRFGMGLSAMRISSTKRRDRLLLLSALAITLLTLLGAAGEAAGIDRHFKVNTSTKRQYSLFRQGCDYYEFLPDMRDEWAKPLIAKFAELLAAQPFLEETLAAI